MRHLRRLRGWLFRRWYPTELAILESYAYASATDQMEARLRTLYRTSPLDESEWVRKFVTLDEDYRVLADEAEHLRNENRYLARRVRELEIGK